MAGPQINVQASQAALVSSIQAGINAYNQRFAQSNQINLSINQRSFSQPLGRITGDVKDFEAALAASNARVVAFGASTAVLGGVVKSFKEIANVTIEVEKNLTDINRVFNLSTQQLQKFSSALFDVSKATSSSFNEASKAALEFSRQGIKAEDVLQRTTDALLLARLGGLSTANAIDALTASVNGFKNTGITTTQILNKLVAVEQNYAVSAGDLAEALSRTGQAAQEAGVNIDQLNALVTSAQEKTARGGAVIGNALKTIFTRLQRTDTLDQLEAFNVNVRDIQGNVLPAITILKNLSGAYKGLADVQRAQLSEQVAGVYQVNILKAILSDLNSEQSAYNGALKDGTNATNEAQLAAAQLNKTLDALVTQTGVAAQQFANNIGKVTFEPLAKYTAETFKSVFENLNDILEGEGLGSIFANGFLKGIRNIIAGPGAIAAFYTLFKLIQNSFNFLTQALPQIAGITTEAQKRRDIEASVLKILQTEGPLRQALVGYTGNLAAQTQIVLNAARAQTAEYQQQLQIAKQLAPLLAQKGVAVNPRGGNKGLGVTRSSGFIPKSTKTAEIMGARMGGYNPGQVVKSPVGGVMNTAEDVKYLPGFAQPFINPPEKSRAGKIHRANALRQTGVDPYMYRGFIPNFFADAKKSKLKQSLERGRDFEKLVGKYIGEPPSWNGAVDFKVVPNIPDDTSLGFNKKYYDSGTFADAHSGLGHTNPQIAGKIIRHSKLTYKNLLQHSNEDFWFDDNELVFVPDFTEIIGKGQDDEFLNKTKISSLSSDSKSEFLKGLSREEMQKAMNQKILLHYYKDRVNLSGGFIPNFADMSMSQIAAAVRLGRMSEADARAMGWKPTSEKIAERKGRVAQEKADKLAGITYNNIDVPWKTYDEFGGPNYEYGAAYEKHALSVLKGRYPDIQDAISAGIPGGSSSRVDALSHGSKTFFEFKGGDPTTPAELMAKFKGVRVQLVDKYRKELDTWNDVLVSNPNWRYSQGFIPNFNMGDKMRKNMLANNLRPILFDLANNKYGYSGQDGKEYLYHKDIYNNNLKTKGANINDFDFAELPNLVRGFIYPNGKIEWDYSEKQQEALKDSNIKAKVLAKLNTAKPKLATGKPKVLTEVQKLRMQLEAEAGASTYARGFIPNFAGKEINTKFFRTKTGFGEPFSKEEGTGLSGTVYRQPGFKSYGYQLKEQLNNMVMSILGNNVFIPDTSYINPRLTDDVNAYAENSARVAALRLSSGGKTKSLGMERGMMSEAFGNSRYVFNPNSVYTGQVSGKMKRVNYDRLSDVLGAFWSSQPDTKSAWEFLKNLSESGKYEDKQNIRPKTALLKKAYNDWLAKNQYIGTRVKLSDYRQGAEGVRGANYAALRSDLAGVSNLQNLGEMEKLQKYKEQGIFYGDYKNNKAMYDKMGRWTYNAATKKMILNSASGFIPNLADVGVLTGDSLKGAAYKQALQFLADTTKPISSIIGPAGSGKTTRAVSKYGGEIMTDTDFNKYSSYVFDRAGFEVPQKDTVSADNIKKIMAKSNMIDILIGSRSTIKSAREKRVAQGDLNIPGRTGLQGGNKGIRGFTKAVREFAKNNPQARILRMLLNEDGTFSHQEIGGLKSALGFIPNFAYKDAVMGLEQSLSGEKAIFDTKPFPHIRNASQPTFSSAIADHGGLNNALGDSLRNQKRAGLMSGGFIPNFVKGDKGISSSKIDFSTTTGGLMPGTGSTLTKQAIKNLTSAINDEIKSFKQGKISRDQLKANTDKLIGAQNLNIKAVETLNNRINKNVDTYQKQQKEIERNERYERRYGSGKGTVFQQIGGAIGGIKGRSKATNIESKLGGLSNNVGFQLAAPIVGGVLEEAITQGKDRSQLSVGQRFAGNAASSVLTGISTGAALGTAFGGPGIGTAVGAVIGLGNAALQAQNSVQDLANAADQYKAQTEATLNAGQSYIDQLKQIGNITDPSLLNQATYKISESFQELSKTSPELGRKFYEASGDVEKMQKVLQEFTKEANIIKSIKALEYKYKVAGDSFGDAINTRVKRYKKKGYDVAENNAFIKDTEASMQTAFVQFQDFFDVLSQTGLTKENAANFIEDWKKEMQEFETDEADLKAIAQRYNISEVVATQLAALSDNVIDEMGGEGEFFVRQSGELVKRFYDETNKKFKTATQQAKEVQFNSRELLLKLRSGIDNYIFNVAKQIQEKEFESSRLSVLDNAASEFIDKLISPLESGARQAEAKIRQTYISQETERMRLSSDIAGASGKQIFETLGGGDKGVIEGLQKTVDNLQDPNLLEDTLKTLIQQTSSSQAAKEANFKVGDPEKLAIFNTQLKQQLQNTVMLSEKQKQQLEIQNLELELLNRRSEAAQVLLELEFQLINSELERNKVLNKSVRENQVRIAKQKAIFERPGFGFGMSATEIQNQKAVQQREEVQSNQAIERQRLYGGGEDFFKSRITKVVQDLKSARLIQSKNVEDYYQKNPFDKIFGISSNKESDKYNNLLDVETKLQSFSTGQIKSVDDYKKRLEDLMSVLTPVSDTNKQIYDEVAKQLKAVNDLTEAQKSESEQLDINLETQRLQALQISLANKFYNERLATLLETADAEQRAADALEIRLQALDTYQSRESNFYNGLGVMGNAGVQVGLNNKRLAIRQEQTTQQNISGARGAINEFATYRNEIANLNGPLSADQQAAKNAIANIGTEIKNLDDAKAFADNLAKARNSLNSSSEDAKKLATFENQVRGILQKNTSELEKQKAIQDLINKGVLNEAADRTSMAKGFQSGFNKLISDSDEIGFKLGQEIPSMFADGMSNALMEVAKGTKTIGDAFKDMAINFGQTLMQEVMRAAIGRALGSAFGGLGLFGNQKGGLIRAQNGMYISGGRNGDRNLALLEDGEYVLNRNAVESFGGPGVLDKINYDMAPRFGSKMQGGGSFELAPEMQYNKDQQFDYTGNLMSGSNNLGQIDQANYTAYAFAEDAYFQKMREKAVQDEQERVQKEFAKKQKNAQLISSIVGAVGSIALGAGLSGLGSAGTSGSQVAKGVSEGTIKGASEATQKGLEAAVKEGPRAVSEFAQKNASDILVKGQALSSLKMMSEFQSGVNPLNITGSFSKFSGGSQLSSVLSEQGIFSAKQLKSMSQFGNIFTTGAGVVGSNVRRGRQTGGLIGFNNGGFVPYGSRLSDTIPALLTGGEYVISAPSVKKYGLQTMNSLNAGSFQNGGSTATTNNSTNNNATNISINIDKSGKSVYGADSSSYEKQDIVFSKQMAKQINSIVLRSMSNEKRYGGELYKNPLRS